jgi:chorismate synthase
MRGNIFGKAYKISTYGESHGPAIGVTIDGCPSNLEISERLIQEEMDRRRPGQSSIVTQRQEGDIIEILSGVFEGKTTGTPISIIIRNKDQKSKDYSHIKDSFRPSHADYTYTKKYGHRDYRGGGRSSARETAARVAAGAIARQYLNQSDIQIHAYVTQVGSIVLEDIPTTINREIIEQNIIRCPDQTVAEQMIDYIKTVKKNGDTVGGVIACVIKNCPVGLGEPVFDKLHADLGKAMLSINAVKGFEIGSGFSSVTMMGSEHNDVFVKSDDKITTETNFSGGIQGGISNGMDIFFKVAFKPVATIMRDQQSINKDGDETTVKGKGRHDPCVVPRAVPIVEAMACLVILDHLLRQRTTSV